MKAISHYIWLLLCYEQLVGSDFISEYDGSNLFTTPKNNWPLDLPVDLGVDKFSGCICRRNDVTNVIACFGGYSCKRFPKVHRKSIALRVRTSVIKKIERGSLDYLYYLNTLELESNHHLAVLESGSFRNLSSLEKISISYSSALTSLPENIFQGLKNLKNLTMVGNGFINILDITRSLRPTMLPVLDNLDLSENLFEVIPKETFLSMRNNTLKKLKLSLCQIDYIHPKAFVPLRNLKELTIGENDINSTLIKDFMVEILNNDIRLEYLDLTGMTFRKHPPKPLLEVIAKTTISVLIMARNQFELLLDDTFPTMKNLELFDLRHVSVVLISPNAFNPTKFPKLRILLLNGNHLTGIHHGHIATQLYLLDLSYNTFDYPTPTYFEIVRDTFRYSKEMRILNLSYNIIKAISNYTFSGLDKLQVLNMENGTIFHIGSETFKAMPRLEVLNLASNPLTASKNLTKEQFYGLEALKILSLRNCGIKFFDEEDNIFELMPNLTHLILKANHLYSIAPRILAPLTRLEMLDLSDNFLLAWNYFLFYGTPLKPLTLYLDNNKISHFTVSMLQDITHILDFNRNNTEIEFSGNVFSCDCNGMYTTYVWLEVNATYTLKQFFTNSKFICASPDLWEDRRVVEYLRSIKGMSCIMYDKLSSAIILIWSTPSIILIVSGFFISYLIVKYRIYLRYWLFLAKLAMGRRIRSSQTKLEMKVYEYDAFISYSNDDRDFVMNMISNLENSPPYLKLCVYERDFEIGAFISESVLNSINNSRFVILVISNSFAQSQWCRWETQLAEYHRLLLEDGAACDPLVLVRLGDIEPKYLTATLKFLLKSKIYLSWDENNPNDFWKRLRHVLVKR